MNLYQKGLLCLFIPVTLIIIALDYIFPKQYSVEIIKFMTMAALLLASLYVKKRYNEQLLLLLALFFAVSGDLFFVLLESLQTYSKPIGIICFSIAYISLTTVFSKGNSLTPVQTILTAFPILALIIPVCYNSYSKVSGLILPIGIIFTIILSYMAWSALKAPFRCYFSRRAAVIIVIAGLLIIICDCSVILSMFAPSFYCYRLILKAITWGAWIPAWTLIAVLIAEDNLVNEK